MSVIWLFALTKASNPAYFNASKMNFYERILQEYNERNEINLKPDSAKNNSFNDNNKENEIIIEDVKLNEESV